MSDPDWTCHYCHHEPDDPRYDDGRLLACSCPCHDDTPQSAPDGAGDVPQDATTAATTALLAYWGNPPWDADEVLGPVTAVLAAAGPVIAAEAARQERQRIRELAIEQAGKYDDVFEAPGALRLFADLLGGEPQ